MSASLTPDEALAVLAKLPADSPLGCMLKETMVDAERLRLHVRDLKRRIRLARGAIKASPLTAFRDAYRLLDLRRPLPKRGRR